MGWIGDIAEQGNPDPPPPQLLIIGKGNVNKMKIRTIKKTHEVVIVRGDDEGIFEVNPMTPREINKLLKKYTVHEKRKGLLSPETDFLGFIVAKTKKTISGWNLENEKGEPLECTDKNKEIAYMQNPDLINDVLEKADRIASGTEEIEQDEEKN